MLRTPEQPKDLWRLLNEIEEPVANVGVIAHLLSEKIDESSADDLLGFAVRREVAGSTTGTSILPATMKPTAKPAGS